jgi:hypothetical protein
MGIWTCETSCPLNLDVSCPPTVYLPRYVAFSRPQINYLRYLVDTRVEVCLLFSVPPCGTCGRQHGPCLKCRSKSGRQGPPGPKWETFRSRCQFSISIPNLHVRDPRFSVLAYDDDESPILFHHNSTADLRLPDSYQRGLSSIQVFALLRCFVYELWSEICRQEARLDGL